MSEKDYYKIGYDYFWDHKETEDYYGLTRQEYTDLIYNERSELSDGYKAAQKEYLLPYTEKFFAELKRVEEENNASVNTGCGCCGGGYYITVDGVEFEIQIGA